MKRCQLLLSLLLATLFGCSTTQTATSRELSARPRVEQRALSDAMAVAMNKIDFTIVRGKKVFIRTQSLSKIDLGFINAFIEGRIIAAGGHVAIERSESQIEMSNIVNVSGTDELHRVILSDKVRGEFNATAIFLDTMSGKILENYAISGIADVKRLLGLGALSPAPRQVWC